MARSSPMNRDPFSLGDNKEASKESRNFSRYRKIYEDVNVFKDRLLKSFLGIAGNY